MTNPHRPQPNPHAPRLVLPVTFKAAAKGRKRAVVGAKPVVNLPMGRLPKVARLMALAIRFEHLIRSGDVADYAEIARLGHVSRARVTQIMNLLHLAPSIQDALLHLPRVEQGRDPVNERDLRPIAALVDWHAQRLVWTRLAKSISKPVVSA